MNVRSQKIEDKTFMTENERVKQASHAQTKLQDQAQKMNI
jgi:hypothetical protein